MFNGKRCENMPVKVATQTDAKGGTTNYEYDDIDYQNNVINLSDV